MSNYFLKRRRPILLYVLTGVAGVVLLVAIGLVIEVGLGLNPPGTAQPPPGPGTGRASSAGGSHTGAGLGPVQLIQGDRVTDGVYLGYPHTMAGAISAAVQDWSQIGSTLSPDRASRIGSLVSDPSWKAGPATMAQGATATRQGLGLPTSGPVPAGASVTLTPMEYQLRQPSADRVTVLLLGYYVISLPQQRPQTRVGVYPITMHWSGGDWKVMTPDTSTDYSGLRAEPGSSQAAALGWQPLRR